MNAHISAHIYAHTYTYQSYDRIFQQQLATLISRSMGWHIDHVFDELIVRMYCTTRIVCEDPSDSRTYWATESRYPYPPRSRRDMVEIDLGNNRRGMAQIISFLVMENTPVGTLKHAVVIRWMSPSSRSQANDDFGRPLCEYPLCSNHCLWEWSDSGRNRQCFSVRGFANKVNRQRMWDHVPQVTRGVSIAMERRARYDVVEYDRIVGHANVAVDPSTGHMLQTLQMI